jgi:hypothetical protein
MRENITTGKMRRSWLKSIALDGERLIHDHGKYGVRIAILGLFTSGRYHDKFVVSFLSTVTSRNT